MKKIITAILVLAMFAAMSVTAFAASPIESVTSGSNTDSTNVKGTYVAGAVAAIVYSVDIVWGSMEFTYTSESEGTWDPETHTYKNATAAAWSCETDANKITVTNHSNAPVDAKLSYTQEAAYTAITAVFAETSGTENDNTLELATAAGTALASAPFASASLTLSGALADGISATKIGTVTVTIDDIVG